MREEQLNRSLENLFSDVSLPDPESSDGRQARRERMGPGRPEERPRGDALDGRLRARAPEREGLPWSLQEAPPVEPDASASAAEPPQFQSVEPKEEAPYSAASSMGSTDWRRELLQTSLYAGLVIGFLIAGLGCYRSYTAGRAQLMPFYVLTYLLLLVAIFWRQIPYSARAASPLVLIYGLGFLDLVQFGFAGDGSIFMLTVPVLAAIFFGRLQGIIALSLSSLTHALFAWAISVERFVPLESSVASLHEGAWWWAGAGAGSPLIFVLIGSGLLVVQNRLMPYIAEALEHGLRLTSELADYQARAETQKGELKQRALQLELLVELGRIAASRLHIDGILQRAVELIPDYLNCYLASVFLLDESGEAVTLRAATGAIGAELEASGLQLEVRDTSIVGWTAGHRRPYVAPEVDADALYRPHPVLGGTMSEVAVPLKAHGFLLGVLDVQAGSRGALGEADVRVLRCVADQLAMAVQDARYASDDSGLLDATSPLYRASRRLSGATTVDEVVQVIVDSVMETEADGCLIGIFEAVSARVPVPSSQSGYVRYLGTWHPRPTNLPTEASDQGPQRGLQPGAAMPLTESPLSMGLMEQFWSVTNVLGDDRLPREVREVFEAIDAGACVNVPLQARGENVGHLLVLQRKSRAGDRLKPFSTSSVRLLEGMGEQAAVALQRAQLLDEAQHLARREELAARAAARMHQSLDLESVLSTAVRDIGETLGLSALDVRLGSVPKSFDRGDPAGGNGGGRRSETRCGEEG